mgnify:CR=1 FL=1
MPWGSAFTIVRDDESRLAVDIGSTHLEYVLDGQPHRARSTANGYTVETVTTATRANDRITILLEVVGAAHTASPTIITYDGEHLFIAYELTQNSDISALAAAMNGGSTNIQARYSRAGGIPFG